MKKNFGRFVLTIYLLTLAVVSHAQVLKGTVIDAATGEALIGASIQLKGTASGTITDIDGRFELKDLKEGNQKLVISYIFYRTAEIDVEVKAENQELNIGLELIVRLRSLAGRRQFQTDPAPQTYRIGEFTFHPDTLRLDYAGTSEELSPREAKILELLCASKGETLYTRPLLLEIWGDDDFFNSRSLQVFISKLRRRLEPDPRIRIVNVRGEGYKLLVNE